MIKGLDKSHSCINIIEFRKEATLGELGKWNDNMWQWSMRGENDLNGKNTSILFVVRVAIDSLKHGRVKTSRYP